MDGDRKDKTFLLSAPSFENSSIVRQSSSISPVEVFERVLPKLLNVSRINLFAA